MRVKDIFVIVAELHVFYVVCSHGIRVHDDNFDDLTTLKPLLTTTTTTKTSRPTEQMTSISSKGITTSSNRNRTIPQNVTKSYEAVNISATLPRPVNIYLSKKNSPRLQNSTALLIKKQKEEPIQKHLQNIEPTKNFVPSPELIVDASESSESNEKFIIKKNHHYVIPYSNSNDNSRSIIATNHSPEQFHQNDYATEYLSTTTAPDHAQQYGSAINEDDKLPWPHPYENTKNEFKWKTVKSMLPYLNYHDSTVAPYPNVKPLLINAVPTYNPTITPPMNLTDSSTFPSLTSPPSIQHPYAFESIYATPNVNYANPIAYIPNGPSYEQYQQDIVNGYARPLAENLTYGFNPRDQSNPVEFIDKGVFWHTAFKWLATAIPIGLVISALSPNVVIVNPNSTIPYPPVRFPSPYSTRLPSKVNIPTRNRIERFSVNKLNHMAFLERSKAFRKNDNILASIVCENRYLCELGSIAVDEENATKSAHTLYKALWRLPNERSKQKSHNDMNEIFKSIQDGNCEQFECSMD